MNRVFSKSLLLVISVILAGCFEAPPESKTESQSSSSRQKKLSLKQQPIRDLFRTSDGIGYLHKPTRSTFYRPTGWKFDGHGKQIGIVHVEWKQPETGDKLTVGWMRKNGDLKSVVQVRIAQWIEKDGAENVSPWKTINLRNRTALYVSRISKNQDGKKFWETSYFFEATEDNPTVLNDKNKSWLITIRTSSTRGKVDALALSMANHLQWAVGEKKINPAKKDSNSSQKKK